jgi:hypothetical protein
MATPQIIEDAKRRSRMLLMLKVNILQQALRPKRGGLIPT